MKVYKDPRDQTQFTGALHSCWVPLPTQRCTHHRSVVWPPSKCRLQVSWSSAAPRTAACSRSWRCLSR